MPPYGVLPATLDEVLSQSDFLSMHAPGTPETGGMLKEQHFRRMKPNAIFINTGRGKTVDEAALIKALEEKWIAHAALDVLETEPPGHNNPLLSYGQRDALRTRRVRIGPVRPGPQASRRTGAGARRNGQMADELRQSVRPGRLSAVALAADQHGAGAELVAFNLFRAARPCGLERLGSARWTGRCCRSACCCNR